MPEWRNWSGRQAGKVDSLHFLRSEADAVGLVNQCRAENDRLKVVGSGHSHSPVALGDGVVADVSGLAGVISVDREEQSAWIRAGSTIYSLGGQLHDAGLALHNQGDIDRQ
ncbi:MAG: FAD-binding protein, partial [Pseudomonadales bacterium]